VESLADLLDRGQLSPEHARVNSPTVTALSNALEANGNAATAYEREVFNALLRDRSMVGIKHVNLCRNVRIDGVLELEDGRRLALEVKYRMNWPKGMSSLRADQLVQELPADEAI
jgi:hypothetical protein